MPKPTFDEARASEGDRRVAALAEMFLTDGRKAAKPDLHQEFRHDGAGASRPALSARKPAFAALYDKLAHLRMAEASAAVLVLADAVRAEYERRKRAGGRTRL